MGTAVPMPDEEDCPIKSMTRTGAYLNFYLLLLYWAGWTRVQVRDWRTSTCFESHRMHDARFYANRSISLAAMAQDAAWIQHAADDWQHDWQLTISCILQYCVHGPQHVPFVTSMLTRDGFLLEFLPSSFQANRQVVMAAVATSGSALQFASAALREDKAVVLEAMTATDPFSLEYAGTSWKVGEYIKHTCCFAVMLPVHSTPSWLMSVLVIISLAAPAVICKIIHCVTYGTQSTVQTDKMQSDGSPTQ